MDPLTLLPSIQGRPRAPLGRRKRRLKDGARRVASLLLLLLLLLSAAAAAAARCDLLRFGRGRLLLR